MFWQITEPGDVISLILSHVSYLSIFDSTSFSPNSLIEFVRIAIFFRNLWEFVDAYRFMFLSESKLTMKAKPPSNWTERASCECFFHHFSNRPIILFYFSTSKLEEENSRSNYRVRVRNRTLESFLSFKNIII